MSPAHAQSTSIEPRGEGGGVYWVTGLPGSGKTTLAHALSQRLRHRSQNVIVLDGDRLRAIFGDRYGYSRTDRRAIAGAYGRLCADLSDQGATIVCATVSMFEDVRAWNRAHIPRYREIYLKAPIDVLVRRHPKGLYAAGLAGRMRNVPGMDLAIEEPRCPDIVIEDDGLIGPEAVAHRLFEKLAELGEDM